MSKEVLSIIDSQRITALFKEKKWDVDLNNKHSLFNRYKSIFLKFDFTDDEKELLLKLSYNMELIEISDYLDGVNRLLIKAVNDIPSNLNMRNNFLYIMPIIPEKSSKKNEIKSSMLLSYLCRSTSIYYNDSLAAKKINLIGGYNDLEHNKKQFINQNRPLLLIDDFIGSGRQAIESINNISKLGIEKKNIIVLALCIHEDGKENFETNDIKFYYENLIEKKVTGVLNKKEEQLLESIEKKINVKSGYNRGYSQSEALISLIRTPNNTLPIFHTVRKGGLNIAPFPRN